MFSGLAILIEPSPLLRFEITNLDAFHSLLAKLRLDSSFCSFILRLFPADVPVVNANRTASAPYSSIRSRGLSTLPLVLLIFTPSGSKTRP